MKDFQKLEDEMMEAGCEFAEIEFDISVSPDLVTSRAYRKYKIDSVLRKLEGIFEEIAEDNGQTIDGVTLEVRDAAQDMMANYARIRRYAKQAEEQYEQEKLDKQEADLLASNAMAAEFKAAAGDTLRHRVIFIRAEAPFKPKNGFANVCSGPYRNGRQESCLGDAIKFKQIMRTGEAGLKGFEFKGEILDGTELIGVDKAAQILRDLEAEGE